MKSLPRRFALLAACLLVAACASAPETKTTPRKKKHKKHDDDEVAEKHTKKKKSSDDDSDKPDKPKKKTADASEDEETVTVDDDEEETTSAKAKKNKKKKEAEEKAAEEKERKQREKEEKAEREKQKAEEEKERKQREKEEKAAREKAKAEEEKQAKAEREKEAKAKKKKKTEEEVAEDDGDGEKPAKKKKNVEEVEEEPAEVDMTGEGDGDETKTAAKAKKGKPAPKTAAKGKAAKGKAPAKAKKKAVEEEPAETSDDTETAAVEEPEPETPVAEEKAKPSKGTKAKLAKAEKPPKTKGDKAKTEPADADVIEMSGDDNTGSDTRVAAIPVPGVDSEHEEPELGTAKANTDGPAPAAASTSAINDRPLTLPASKLEVHGGLRVNSIYFPATMGTLARTQRSEGLALGVGYGVTDTIEVGADYTVLVNPGTVKGPITFHGAYRAYVTPKLEIAAAVGLAIDFDPRVDPTTMKESTLTYAALELGAWARYRLNRKASLFSGLPGTPSSSASITKLAFPLPPQPYQIAVGLNGGPSALDLPVGIGYQLTGSFYTLFMTDLSHFGLNKNSPNAFLFKDIIPFALGGFYVFEKVDFGLVLSDDLKKDTLRFDAVVRYPIK